MARHVSPITLPGHRVGVPSANKGKKFPTDILAPEEVMAMVEAQNCGATGLRNRAIIVTLWRTGVRNAELCGLRAYDFDFERRSVRVRGTKTRNSDRIVAIDRQALLVVNDWLDVRADELHLPRHTNAFCCVSKHERGGPLKPTYVRQMVKHAAAKVGIDRRVWVHMFRHTFTADLIDDGVDLRLASKQLGHASSAQTAHYADHINPRRMIEVISSREWPDIGRAA